MPTFKFKFYGAPAEKVEEISEQSQLVQPEVGVVEYEALTVRSGDAKAVDIEVSENDLVSMRMSNDVEWLYNAEDFEKFIRKQPGTRSAESGELVVPAFFTSTGSTRGFEDVIKTRAIKIVTGMAARKTAQLLAEKMESKLQVGLYGLDEQFKFINFDRTRVAKDKPYLLFIHGTNSNTEGAFCELKSNNAYTDLFKFYEGRVLAFEHKTLSQSPLKNVTDLLQELPDEIILDVVSHSRGGLIADLLARCNSAELPFSNDEISIINTNPDFQTLKTEAEAANAAATGKNIIITKTVRVAATAAGTVLIDTRLDNLVNVLFNLIKLIPGAAACMPLGLFLDFARAVVHERTEVNSFPGLAAQIPGSPLVRMLNNPNRQIKSRLFVISGDVEHSGFWKSMLVMSSNLYFGEAHDLVVNSNSMFKGTYRNSDVLECFEQTAAVNHFNYFKNSSSQKALMAALMDTADIPKFYENLGITNKITKVHVRGVPGKKPVLYVIPGITNTILKNRNNETLWINIKGLATGALSKLTVAAPDIIAAEIQEQVYGDLINFLSTDFDVKPFPYDWRVDLAEAGKLLADDIQKELNNPERTVREFHFIAHSMGGLVLRAMIHSHKQLWKEINESKKTKVLMLGVPNEGSYSIIRLLMGKDAVIKKLALIDFVHSKRELLGIFKDFTGLLQLLPKNEGSIFGEDEWNKLVNDKDDGGKPSADRLRIAADFYRNINDTEFDNSIFRYVAGQADNTPSGYTVTDNKISFSASSEGDGRVLWSTIPTGLNPENIYYVNADHGSIPQYKKAFEGFRELLQKGKTTAAGLSTTKPVSRGILEKRDMPDSDFVTVPGDIELESNLLSNTEPGKKSPDRELINVSVINGDLVHSKYPVVVGHFKGDGIVAAEKYLDQALGFRLSEYHIVNNYPGDIGTHLIILDDKNERNRNMICEGGVVVGLGEFGTLTESRLLVTLTQALLTLAIRFNELLVSNPDKSKEEVDFGISALTVGSDFAGLRITTCVKAIFLAVLQANEKLEAMSKRDGAKFNYKKINHIEVVEIYQHKSIQVGRVISDFLMQDGFSNFRFVPPEIRPGSGALNQIADENLKDNWHRLEVTVIKREGYGENGTVSRILPIRFTSITDKAHADEKLLPANRVIVDTLVEKLSKHSLWDKSFSQTLYELLVPNNFKGFGASLQNLVLIVDKDTARYPWELLHDANGISEKPMVINTGIVRQLKSGEQRENIIINSSNRALVIGNPYTGDKYPPLPSAENEANEVVKILVNNGLETSPSIAEHDIDIIRKLLPVSYKIIHIASHGIVGKTEEDPTGIVLGNEIIFTASDFNQIPIVPEFVFVNCCSTAKYDPAIEEQMRKKYQLAASVGIQLIQMGVKAAIVTGWEIDDAAAQTFSSSFYTNMFKGKTFGDAVRSARLETFEKHPHTNTWGAYQCYGDPFYAFKNSSGTKKTNYNFVDPIEVVYVLDNLIGELTSGLKRKTTEEWQNRIKAITDALPFSWNKDARIIERLATVCKMLNWYGKAIMYYEILFSLENATYTIKSIEQYYNIKIRLATDQLKKNEINFEVATQVFNEAIEGLKKLNGNTQERYCLIAASYRRFYEFSNDRMHLSETARYYRIAYEHTQQMADYIDFYPYFNWLHHAIILSDLAETNPFLVLPPGLQEFETKALNYARVSNLRAPDFFKKIAPSSAFIAQLLQSVDEAGIKEYIKEIEVNFYEAWKKEGTASDRNSFIDYIASIIFLLKKNPPMTLKQEKIDAMQDLINRILKL